jgi:calcium-binding protein CML
LPPKRHRLAIKKRIPSFPYKEIKNTITTNQQREEGERQHFLQREKQSDPTQIRKKMGKDLSDDQVSSMKEAFTLFDTDGDGKIAPSELGILMRSLGGNPTQAQLKSIISQENLTAPFDFPRFLDLMAKHMKAEPFDRQLRDAFKVLDKDNTGFVAVADLRHILTSIGEKLELAEFDEWIREVDVGSDGRIRYEDFIARMVTK